MQVGLIHRQVVYLEARKGMSSCRAPQGTLDSNYAHSGGTWRPLIAITVARSWTLRTCK